MTWGIGAMVASIALARLNWLVQRGSTLCFAAILFALSILIFGYSRYVPLTAFANFTLGIAFTTMLVSSSTIVQQTVTDAMRGRVMGLFPLTMGLAQLNTMSIGAIAQLVGLTVVVPALGWITLAICIAIIVGQPALRRVAPRPGVQPAPPPASPVASGD
jgi:predicted MFS family arabinose efflux permease